MTIHELAHQVGGGLNNQQNQWTAQLKQVAPPCGWKGITMRKVVGIVTPRVSKPHDYANHMFMRL
jgi:hypothetical protein